MGRSKRIVAGAAVAALPATTAGFVVPQQALRGASAQAVSESTGVAEPPRAIPEPTGFSGAATAAGLAVSALAAGSVRRRRAGGASAAAPKPAVVAVQATGTMDRPSSLTQSEKVQQLDSYIKARGGKRLLKKVLIANNGMAATKSIMSMRQWAYLELGLEGVLEFVVMATREDLDANAEFIRLADTFVEVPAGKNVNNYANVDLICKVAKEQGVDAVWPGWGHASENPDLPIGLKALGIEFMGPTSPVMSVLGDKIAANILAQTAGVPSIPWSGDGLQADLNEEGTIPDEIFKKGCVTNAEEAAAVADRIGYPVMVKASEGGGGKGIRMCGTKDEIIASFPQVVSEAPPGSPVFVMQLCSGARHIEVQIMGDEYGNAVALNGRDCSTQRRFQKIFEEGPPVVVPKDTFLEMERAAQRLTQNLGYVGAGTVEYLYNAKENVFYFLELNPRLQVEHPVTEQLTQVNLPATQLQVAMGIPLSNIPQIRKFYGRDVDDISDEIDFLKDRYVYPDRHVIASRITAENPDDGFKPTSGKIQRIKFQSSVSCWGYFSVGANGGIHEYADSQFGHIFAHGPNREEARKALSLALRNIDVVGDIRNPVEYLVELLDMEDFKDNTIDTSWLDGLIKERTVQLNYSSFDVVFYSAVYRAMAKVKEEEGELLETLGKSQIGLLDSVSSNNKFPIEITFEGKKYNFQVKREGPATMTFTIGGKSITTRLEGRPDGSIFVTVGTTNMKISGTEEALGLRLRMEGIATVMVPTIYDPSELRSEFNGKIVRYLQDNGGAVKAGEPYVELEAMKMIMSVKAASAGKIEHTRGAGSIVAAGELLGSLQLDDPSSVVKIVPFEGDFSISSSTEGDPTSMQAQVELALDGFAPLADEDTLVQQLFAATPAADAPALACMLMDRYLAVEEKFASLYNANLNSDQIFLALINENKESLGTVVAMARAHNELKVRNEIIVSILRSLADNVSVGESVVQRLEKLVGLPSAGGYGEVSLVASQFSSKVSAQPFADRLSALKSELAGKPDLAVISQKAAVAGGTELLAELLASDSAEVRSNALDGIIRRTYRSIRLEDIKVSDKGPSDLSATFKFAYPTASSEQPMRSAYTKVVASFDGVKQALDEEIPMQASGDASLNAMAVIVGPGAFSSAQADSFYATDAEFEKQIADTSAMLLSKAETLGKAGVREFIITALQAPNLPRYASFRAEDGWKEGAQRRDMRPTFGHLLEVSLMADSYDLKRIIPVIGRNSQVYLGTLKGAQPNKAGKLPQTLFARMITHTLSAVDDGEVWMEWPEQLLLSGLNELERARLNPKVGTLPNSSIFANILVKVDQDAATADMHFERFMNLFVAKHGGRLQKSKVDEITIKVGFESAKKTLRLTASSQTGEYLKTSGVLEEDDPTTGLPMKFTDVRTGEPRELAPAVDEKMRARRQMARAAGSTYAPEFLGMMKLELINKWSKYRAAGGTRRKPTDVFAAVELVLEGDELVESSRRPGSNNVGMIAWKCSMQTPEYPEGREIVVIANDVTFQAGSFGVAEDVFFEKASQYARKKGLPRIHIACNSGARVGLVEELKPYIKAKWTDPEDPSRGFDALYLDEEDYAKFDKGVVEAREDTYEGKKIYVLDGIIGEGLKSTAGGIGVENLQGSGVIAGETSRAYNEIFTLSYVTGRSVGIGAYLNRLGQRVIQMKTGPMILTGFGALNKLLGKRVYSSQDQLGGPQVMVPNGVTHQLVQSDQEGVKAILDWLAFVPKDTWSMPSLMEPSDPVDRDVTFTPSKRPYDPREMLAGAMTPEGEKLSGFFDEGTFQECLEGWGRSVVTGRAKLGGIPMGVIAVETRNVDRRVPADPANPLSQEVVEPQAGQVWFPDSAHKTATAIRDFNRGENLPLIIFANWRGFSGGTRDMYSEVLKFGAQIVDALVDYKHPVFVYIPPGGELRGGSWVVIDPAINPQQMEMYADVESRGGILEPAGIVEVKFRGPQQKEMMHRLDPVLKELDDMLESGSSFADEGSMADVEDQIKAREEKLAPLYTQMACEFADLHDRTGRMEAKGVIRKGLEWKRAREFFYYRVNRRVLEQEAINGILKADAKMSVDQAKAKVAEWVPAEDDKAAVEALGALSLKEKLEELKVAALKLKLKDLLAQLPESERNNL